MKSALVVLAIACLSGCDGGKCGGPYSGTWRGTSGGQINLSSGCDFQYDGPGCTSTGTYGAALATSGSMLVTIMSTTGGQCLPVGSYSCVYTATSSTLDYNCGAGASHYTR